MSHWQLCQYTPLRTSYRYLLQKLKALGKQTTGNYLQVMADHFWTPPTNVYCFIKLKNISEVLIKKEKKRNNLINSSKAFL